VPEALRGDQLSERSTAEIACPSCGEPMLAGWGSTCGKCRPNLVSPKTIFPGSLPPELAGQSSSRLAGMTLGWLIVIRSIDRGKRAALFELDGATNVLSRAGAEAGKSDKLIVLEDEFMSIGHAIVRRPAAGERTDAFTIQDRRDPGPSANGTFVNSHKLAPGEVIRLGDGDVIKLGATELLFKSLLLPGAAPSR
jgi:hypothetical protein